MIPTDGSHGTAGHRGIGTRLLLAMAVLLPLAVAAIRWLDAGQAQKLPFYVSPVPITTRLPTYQIPADNRTTTGRSVQNAPWRED